MSIRTVDWGPRRGVTIEFRPHLKSLSLDVIFSSRLEMWYEALAMLTASIPPANAVGAAARGRRCWGSSSRWRRLPLPGSQRDADAVQRRRHRMLPPWRDVGLSRAKLSYRTGLTTALLAGERAHGRRGAQQGLSGKADTSTPAVSLPLPPHSLPRARGQNPPPKLRGRGRQTRDATES